MSSDLMTRTPQETVCVFRRSMQRSHLLSGGGAGHSNHCVSTVGWSFVVQSFQEAQFHFVCHQQNREMNAATTHTYSSASTSSAFLQSPSSCDLQYLSNQTQSFSKILNEQKKVVPIPVLFSCVMSFRIHSAAFLSLLGGQPDFAQDLFSKSCPTLPEDRASLNYESFCT